MKRLFLSLTVGVMLFTACTTAPKPNKFIKFQDEKAKLLCVKNWDTNGDGQLSYDEAATVTELGGVFNRSAISSFDELKYFTCLAYLERGAFAGCTSLTSVTIPESVTSIDAGAFYGCSSLASVTIPNSITSIGDEAFAGCYSLASITIPESVTEIGRSAFKGCTGELIINSKIIEEDVVWLNDRGDKKIACNCQDAEFTKLTIGDNITKIGSSVFEGCTSLESVTIGNSVTSIGGSAFYNCESLTSITIPHSVTLIDGGAFNSCNSLTSVNYTGDLSAWCKLNMSPSFGATSPLSYGAKFYINGVEQTDITIPSDITEIKSDTFKGCTSLTSVTIPDSVTSIGEYAFYNCTSLTSVTIPNSVTEIGKDAFSSCTSLESVIISNSITEIGEDTFYYCTSLTSVTIPNSVTKIGENAFRNCTSLESVTIPNSVTEIGEWAFSDCTSLTSVTIPESVTWVGKYAFSDCTSLTSVTIPNSDIGIDRYAFRNCTGELIINSKRIVEPDHYTDWNKDSKFTKLTIGDNITKIGYTFHGCTSLESVTIPNSVTEIGKSAFSDCTSLESVTIPNSVTEIGKSAFWECSSLTSVTIPESVTKIGEWAFASCTSLASVYCKATTPPSGDLYMFYKSASDRKIYVPRNSVDAYKSAECWRDYADYIEGYDF